VALAIDIVICCTLVLLEVLHLWHPGENYLRDTRALLLRASLLQHDVVQRAPVVQALRGARGGGPGSSGDHRHFGERTPQADRHMDRVFF
jgi:hypothetical protein